MPQGDEKETDVNMWSPDKDRNEKAQLGDTRQGYERKSTVEDLQDKLQVALSALDETKGALDAAQKRVSELESSVAPAPEEEMPVNGRIEALKASMAFVAVVAVEAVYFVFILDERKKFGEASCAGVAAVALRSCELCGDGTLVMPVGGDYEKSWPALIRSLFYFFVLLWSFQGVGIICDEFMAAIEKITSSKRSKWITNPAGQKVEVRVTVWNETLANLSLMALCSSAPEILLSTVELCSNRFFSGSLGPQTVVGSASFNLFCISSVCISALAPGEVRRVEKYPVFCFTCAASVMAYVWMLVVLAGITPDRVDLAEGVVTLLFFFVFLGIAFILDKYFSKTGVDPDVAEVHRQLEARFGQAVSLEGVQAMMKTQAKKQPIEPRNTKNEAKGQILRLSTGGKKQPSVCAYGFVDSEVVFHEGDGCASLQITALNGPHPAPVRIKYRTRNGMAKAGKRYHQKSGVLHFLPEEEKQELRIPLMMAKGPPEEFYVELTEIKADGLEGKKNPPVITQCGSCQSGLGPFIPRGCLAGLSQTVAYVNSDYSDYSALSKADIQPATKEGGSGRLEVSMLVTPRLFFLPLVMEVRSGLPKNAAPRGRAKCENEPDTSRALSEIRSEIKSEAKSDARSDARSDAQGPEEEDEPFSFSHWMDKAVEAFFCNGSAEEQAQATAFDWLMHCLALTWKTAFLIVPPPSLLGAYPAFFCSLLGIGLVTVVINDAASLLGCSIGMADDLTAITLVALGTSLPDTMASRTSAKSDETADNSIGNITGSNAVNVLLGMGISWTIGAAYWAHNGVTDEWKGHQTTAGNYETLYLGSNPEGGFIVVAGAISFSVSAFAVLAMLCVALLYMRRVTYGGELGGPLLAQRRDSFLCFLLWIMQLEAFIHAHILTQSHSRVRAGQGPRPFSLHVSSTMQVYCRERCVTGQH
ncbi:SLC8A1 [Symbiodinium sp. CCMP2456]|nr:SLC8A1 [Symbiodinium sp. CCMP2456]